MMELGADDLITDKPDLVHELLRQNAEMDTTLLSLRDAIQAGSSPPRTKKFRTRRRMSSKMSSRTRKSSWMPHDPSQKEARYPAHPAGPE